jgi:ribosomal-protein-alanine N-acetyltransferase
MKCRSTGLGSMRSLDERRTARLLLTRMRPADLDEIQEMHADARVMATLGGVRSPAAERRVLEGLLAHWEEHGFGYWVARDVCSRRFLGRGGLRWVEVGGRQEVEVGYGFIAECWGQGLATELARESVAVGFTVLQRPDLVCFTLPTNRASQRVMEKAGFRFERNVLHVDLPHVLYRLTAAEWRLAQCR